MGGVGFHMGCGGFFRCEGCVFLVDRVRVLGEFGISWMGSPVSLVLLLFCGWRLGFRWTGLVFSGGYRFLDGWC